MNNPQAQSNTATSSNTGAAFGLPTIMAFNYFGEVPDATLIPQAAAQKMTDMGLGARFNIHFAGRAVYSREDKAGVWYTWGEGASDKNPDRWIADPEGSRVAQMMRTTIASISGAEAEWAAANDAEVIAAQSALDKAIAKGQTKVFTDKLEEALLRKTKFAKDARIRFGETCETGMGHIRAAMEAAKELMAVSPDIFDRLDTSINCQNGTLELRTLTLKPHDPQDYLTKVTSVAWYPQAKSDDLDRVCLTLAKSDPGNPLFFQRALGCSLTAMNTGKFYVYIKGPKNAGKSSLIEAFGKTLGDLNGGGYGRDVNPSLFALDSKASAEQAQPKLHDLRGIRHVFADEAEHGFVNGPTLKLLASGAEMTTRKLHGGPVTWKSQVKVFFAGNDWTKLPDNDPGLIERLVAIELTHELTREEMDVDLQTRLTSKAGMEAILAWAAQGAHDWLTAGNNKAALCITEQMERTAANYRGDSDPLADFWESEVEEVEDSSGVLEYLPLTSVQWHRLYANYCNQHGYKPKFDERKMKARLEARGFKAMQVTRKVRNHEAGEVRGRVYLGLKSCKSDVEGYLSRGDF